MSIEEEEEEEEDGQIVSLGDSRIERIYTRRFGYFKRVKGWSSGPGVQLAI